MIQVSLDKKYDTMCTITKARRTRGMAQVVGNLPSECKTPEFNSSTAKKKKKKAINSGAMKKNLH
jgi:hypothetical protein